jgi:tRNA U34 5-methylaminomethyl-2-thiouridine-forming methyltransferase MnmC
MPELIITKDGSHTLYNASLDEHYHSIHGAIQESMHVFIEAGLKQLSKTRINILEFGFGTGLNAFLTLLESQQSNKTITYTTIELYPVSIKTTLELNYSDQLSNKKEFEKLHQVDWESWQDITSFFKILKRKADIQEVEYSDQYDLVYFDAFSPVVQPELWTQNIFDRIFRQLNKGAILTTYSAKGSVRKSLQNCGFTVERIPGPPGKREMIRALKH